MCFPKEFFSPDFLLLLFYFRFSFVFALTFCEKFNLLVNILINICFSWIFHCQRKDPRVCVLFGFTWDN